MSVEHTQRILGPVAYQHISDGGFAFQTIKTVTVADNGNKHTRLELEIRHRAMGVGIAVLIPCFQTTAHILRDIAYQIQRAGVATDHNYLQPIDAKLESSEGFLMKDWKAEARGGDAKVYHQLEHGLDPDDDMAVVEDEGQDEESGEETSAPFRLPKIASTTFVTATATLEQLMEKHHIAVFPEYESTVWNAEIYDNESATPTRRAIGRTPLEAVQLALKKAIPEHGDAIDPINQEGNDKEKSA